MPSLEITVSGAEEIDLALRVLGPKIERRIVSKAFRVGAKVMLKAVRQNIRSLRKTGEHTDVLARKMKIQAMRRKKNRVGLMVVTPKRSELGIAEAGGRNSYYPAHIELGTQNNQAEPYMRDAFRDTNESVQDLVVAEINKAVGEALG